MRTNRYIILAVILTCIMFINIGCSTNSWKSQQYTFTGTGEYWDVEASVTENTSSTYRIAFSLNYLQDMSNLREEQTLIIKYLWLPEDVVAIKDEMGNVVNVILPEKLKELSETIPVGISLVQEQSGALTKIQLESNEFFYFFDYTVDESIAEITKMAETLSITIQWGDQKEDIVLVNTGDM